MRMMRLFPCVLVAVLLVGCDGAPLEPVSGDQPLFSGVPADGHGNKAVFDWDDTYPVTCGSGEELTLHDVGWAQFKFFGPPNNRNVELGVFHIVLTYANADGDTWVWRDVGPDHVYVDGDEIFVTITGRSTASGNIDRDVIVVGHVVLNLTSGEVVFVAGRELGTVLDLACDALT